MPGLWYATKEDWRHKVDLFNRDFVTVGDGVIGVQLPRQCSIDDYINSWSLLLHFSLVWWKDPPLNVDGIVPWAGSQTASKGERRMWTSIHPFLLPHCGGGVTSFVGPYLSHENGLWPQTMSLNKPFLFSFFLKAILSQQQVRNKTGLSFSTLF